MTLKEFSENTSKKTSPARRRVGKQTRAEKVEQTRNALLRAAAEVVGEQGYTGAMISLITAKAGVAQGTFYNYFESQQDLLDQLLPIMGRQMLDHIQQVSRTKASEQEREIERFKAFFSFMDSYPEFYRILYEAEVYSPKAYLSHRETVTKGLTRILERAQDKGEVSKDYAPHELEAVALMMMGARHYLCMCYARDGDKQNPLPDWVTDTYMKVLKFGIFPPTSNQ